MGNAEHLVAHTRGGARSLVDPDEAPWLWTRMQRGVPTALSCTLMPDHVHVVAPPGQLERFRWTLSAFTVRFGVRFDLLPPEPANSPAITMRMIRYGFFNPVREGLVDDPWSWRFSTLRDLGGAAHPVWTEPARVATAIGAPSARLLAELTTTADHRATAPQPNARLVASTDALRAAVAAALRWSDEQVRSSVVGRRLVVQAAHAIATPCARMLAAELDCCDRTIRRARAPRHAGLDAVLLCLSDARLRVEPVRRADNSRRPREGVR